MRRWSYGANSLYKTAHIFIEDAPRWAFILEDIVGEICDILYRLPLVWRTPIPEYTHLYIHEPVSKGLWRRTSTVAIEVDYEELKQKLHSVDVRYWKEMEAHEGLDEDDDTNKLGCGEIAEAGDNVPGLCERGRQIAHTAGERSEWASMACQPSSLGGAMKCRKCGGKMKWKAAPPNPVVLGNWVCADCGRYYQRGDKEIQQKEAA